MAVISKYMKNNALNTLPRLVDKVNVPQCKVKEVWKNETIGYCCFAHASVSYPLGVCL